MATATLIHYLKMRLAFILLGAAVPGFIAAGRLKVKDEHGNIKDQEGELYFDGSIEQDIPTAGLSELFNCHFFLASQCNPHILPFFYNNKGDVGRPNRWSGGGGESAWRGGFLLSALELFLKMDVKAKFQFLEKIECTISWTGSMMTQNNWGVDVESNLTTCIPSVSLIDFFKIITDPSRSDLIRYIQGGKVAAWEKCGLMRIQNSIHSCLSECLLKLEGEPEAKPASASASASASKRQSAKSKKSPRKPSVNKVGFAFKSLD